MSKNPFNKKLARYGAVVMRIVERDVYGRPMTCRVLYDEETTKVRDGDAFAIVLMHESHFRKEDKGL